MITDIVTAALEPFMHTIGWQAFAYGVTGKVVIKKATALISSMRNYNDNRTNSAANKEDTE